MDGTVAFMSTLVVVRSLQAWSAYQEVDRLHPSILYDETGGHGAIAAVIGTGRLKEKLLHGYSTSFLYSVFDSNGYYQTILGVLFRKISLKKAVKYDRELLKLQDGGQVGLDWRETENRRSNAPVVVIHHGLCGHSQSGYVKSMIIELEKAGFYVVVFVARACGRVPLTTPETFTASRTSDMHQVLARVRSVVGSEREIHAIGFSLGAGLLLKYLGEQGDNTVLTSAVAICPSFDFHVKTKSFGIFSAGTVKSLQSLVKEHREFLEFHPDSKLDWKGMFAARDIQQFDEAAIVGKDKNNYLHHPTVQDYYTKSSCIRYTKGCTVKTLAICAADDPVCAMSGSPQDLSTVGPGLAVLKIAHGGHIGFGNRLLFPSRYWCDEAASVFIKANCKN